MTDSVFKTEQRMQLFEMDSTPDENANDIAKITQHTAITQLTKINKAVAKFQRNDS